VSWELSHFQMELMFSVGDLESIAANRRDSTRHWKFPLVLVFTLILLGSCSWLKSSVQLFLI